MFVCMSASFTSLARWCKGSTKCVGCIVARELSRKVLVAMTESSQQWLVYFFGELANSHPSLAERGHRLSASLEICNCCVSKPVRLDRGFPWCVKKWSEIDQWPAFISHSGLLLKQCVHMHANPCMVQRLNLTAAKFQRKYSIFSSTRLLGVFMYVYMHTVDSGY